MTRLAPKEKLNKKRILSALQGEVTPRVPFWLMRQAGRYLPEYRALRATAGSFLDLCFNPAFATEVTLQPLKRFDMDAAILFSDILVVPYALGQSLAFAEGEGPRLGELPDFKRADISSFDEKLKPVYETVQRVRSELSPEKALIGFAGAPWTVACYMVDGRGGDFKKAREMASKQPEKFAALIDTLVEATSHFLIQQIKHGADVVQIFDSWAGLVPEEDFQRWVITPTQKIVTNIRKAYPKFPVIGFPRQVGQHLGVYTKTSVSGIGIDQDFSLKVAMQACPGVTLQGNLDPQVLLQGGDALKKAALDILEETRHVPFIFNLGHGVIKETPPEHVAALSAIIQNFRR